MSAITSALNALKYVPASVGVKLLEKANPKFKNYFTSAAAYGYDANQALDYVKDRFENENSKNFKGQLEQGSARGTLRPDEAEAKNQISNTEIPGRVARTAAAYGGAALAGGLPGVAAQAASDVLPNKGQEHGPKQFEGLNLQHGPFQQQEGPMGPFQRSGMQHGPFQQEPKELAMLQHGPFQSLSDKIKQKPKSREEATKLANARSKDKKLLDKLTEDFARNYGSQEQGTAALQQGSAKSDLAALTQQGLALLQKLNGGG